jgi:hypothetical protein
LGGVRRFIALITSTAETGDLGKTSEVTERRVNIGQLEVKIILK